MTKASLSLDAVILLLTLARHEGREAEILADVAIWRELTQAGLARLGVLTPEGKLAAARLVEQSGEVLS